MGQCVQKALLGARHINPLLRANNWVVFDKAQPLNLAKQWLRALPDAMPHGHQHPTVGPPPRGLRGKAMGQCV